MLSWIFIVLNYWNNSPRIDMSLHSDTLSPFSLMMRTTTLDWSACKNPEVRGHVYVCYTCRYRFVLFLQFFSWILELFRQCGIFCFSFDQKTEWSHGEWLIDVVSLMVTSGAESANTLGAHEFTIYFSNVRKHAIFSFLFLCRLLLFFSFDLFRFGHCIACPFSTYGFW